MMIHRLPPLQGKQRTALLLLLALITLARRSQAADSKAEKEAKKLQSEAMDVDFLSLDFKAAKAKLDAAGKRCAEDGCNRALIAGLQRDIGIVYIYRKDTASGEKAFAAALGNDPSLTMGKEFLNNAGVKKAWEAVKRKLGITTVPDRTPDPEPDKAPDPTPDAAPPKPAKTSKTPLKKSPAPTESTGVDSSGIDSEPPVLAEGNLSVALTVAPAGSELPVTVVVPKGLDVASVKVSFKTEAMEKYRSIEAKKNSAKWIAIIDCTYTQSATTIKYFVKAFDADSLELEHYGSIRKPAVVKLVDKLPDDAEVPLLPGDVEPRSCSAASNGEGDDKKPEGSVCKSEDECRAGLICQAQSDGEKWCEPGVRKPALSSPSLWLGLDLQSDILFISSQGDICKDNGWACTVDTPFGRQDVGVRDGPSSINVAKGFGGHTGGGPAMGTTRVFASGDYFLSPNLSLGARLGYAFGGNPTTAARFVPFHGEARLQYFFANGVVRPYGLFSAGYAMMDGGVPDVKATPNDPEKKTGVDSSGQPVVSPITAYRLAGPAFAAIGVGAWLMVADRVAINAALKVDFPLPTFSLVLSPELGMKVGF
ncbi:MAG: hypothetical protein NVS3B20_00420 [Polyangiales bacterium]